MKWHSLSPWLLTDITFFICLNLVLLFVVIRPEWEIFSVITPLKLFIFSFAVWRLANIISNEYVFTVIRGPFVEELEKNGKKVEEPVYEGLRGFIGSLLYCPSCVGVWAALFLVYFYILFPGEASIFILLLSLSGLERLIAALIGTIRKMTQLS